MKYIVLVSCLVLVSGYSIDQRGWNPVGDEQEHPSHPASHQPPAAPAAGNEKPESILDSINRCSDDDDLTPNTTIACHGVKIVRRMMGQLLDQGSKRNFQLSDGLEVVKVAEGSRNLGGNDNSVVGRLQGFLQTHELRVKLQDFLPSSEEWGRAFNGSVLQQIGEGVFTGRGKGKGGGGLIAMALMMKGMLAAIGLGGLGLLAMKALMVSALALMLSAIVGLKKLASKDDGGGHYVSVVPVHHGGGGGHGDHYRRKREEVDNSPYRAYKHYATQQ